MPIDKKFVDQLAIVTSKAALASSYLVGKKEKNFKYQKIGNYDVLTELSVKDIQKDHRTDILFKQIRVDIDMDEKIFQEKSLKRLPTH